MALRSRPGFRSDCRSAGAILRPVRCVRTRSALRPLLARWQILIRIILIRARRMRRSARRWRRVIVRVRRPVRILRRVLRLLRRRRRWRRRRLVRRLRWWWLILLCRCRRRRRLRLPRIARLPLLLRIRIRLTLAPADPDLAARSAADPAAATAGPAAARTTPSPTTAPDSTRKPSAMQIRSPNARSGLPLDFPIPCDSVTSVAP